MAAEGVPWLDAGAYYRARWGEPLGRVGVDGGFSCPNRGLDRTQPGCAFCSEAGNRPPYAGDGSVDDQIARGLAFQRERYGFRRFSLYFQSYSSTWGPRDDLRALYTRGLSLGPFCDLTVGTRPDCLPDETADLLASFQTPDLEVWVELGLQSASDETLRRIRRGHTVADFRAAAARLRERGLKFTVHALYGLPGEGKAAFLETVRTAVDEGAAGLKLHDLLLVPGTDLHREWEAGRLAPVDPEAYLDAAAEAMVGLPAGTVVWRVCSDPEDRRTTRCPGEKWPKNRFRNRLAAEILKRRAL